MRESMANEFIIKFSLPKYKRKRYRRTYLDIKDQLDRNGEAKRNAQQHENV